MMIQIAAITSVGNVGISLRSSRCKISCARLASSWTSSKTSRWPSRSISTRAWVKVARNSLILVSE